MLNSKQLVENRRAFLKEGSLFLLGSSLLSATDKSAAQLWGAESNAKRPAVRIALVTDMHYADKDKRGSRYYRESLDKFAEAAEQFSAAKPDFFVELGDLIDAAPSVETELRYLKRINKEVEQVSKKRHYVLGNHCVDTLTKQEFLGEVGQEKSYYSFDEGNRHFIVLDSCFRSDGTPYQRKNFTWTDPNVSAEELEWLKADLAETKLPTIVFAHQRLDVEDSHGVKNGPAVRKMFEKSGKVEVVFQGHSHHNELHEINGVQYCTLAAMVEGTGEANNGFSLLDIHANGVLELKGFRRQSKYNWS